MSTEENKALIRRLFEEGLNQNNPGVFDALIASDFVIYDPPPGIPPDRQGFRQLIETFRNAFPDLHVTFEAEFADGDYVIHRGYGTGTHQGEFQGIPRRGSSSRSTSFTSGASPTARQWKTGSKWTCWA